MYNYKLVKRFVGMSMVSGNTAVVGINRTHDGFEGFTFIPMNPENTDYQEYLKWVAEGNTPEPADEPQE
jgi:hypothetical protein